jgi:hypothetical protein
MKNPRLMLWYAVIAPLTVVYFLTNIIRLILVAFVASSDVFEVLLFRFEVWARGIDPEALFNNPYKVSLWSTFKTSIIQGY